MFGPRLKELREAAKLTQEELARKLDLHPNSYAQAERGVRPVSTRRLLALAALFGCTVEELLAGAPMPK